MKNKYLFILVFFLTISFVIIGNLSGQALQGQPDKKNADDTSLIVPEKVWSGILSRLAYLETQKKNDELVLINLKTATLIIEIAAFLVAFFVAWSGLWAFFEYRKVKTQIETRLSELNAISERITRIQSDLTGNQTYVQQGLENLFDCLQVNANSTKDKSFLSSIFVKRAITSLYSQEENARFSGITTLQEIGRGCDVIHLEKLILNNYESITNKHLATDAIIAIKTRKKP